MARYQQQLRQLLFVAKGLIDVQEILKWTGIVLGGLIAVLLIANAVFVWRSSAAVESRLQAIRDAGDPVSMGELARPPILPEDNATTFLRRATNDLVAVDKDLAASMKAMPTSASN